LTNVFISSVMSRDGAAFEAVASILRGDVELVICRSQLTEVVSVLQRPELQRFFRNDGDRHRIFNLMESIDSCDDGVTDIVVRDPKDIVILATALTENVDYLITGDRDLIVLAENPDVVPLRIVSPREFLDLIDASQD
jgi:putative PIN family toxin of toxin-antitoxin system